VALVLLLLVQEPPEQQVPQLAQVPRLELQQLVPGQVR